MEDREDRRAPEFAFIEDIFIVSGSNEHPRVRRLRESDWKKRPRSEETELDIPAVAKLLPLIRNEVVVCDVPARGRDEAFTFINLTALAVNKD